MNLQLRAIETADLESRLIRVEKLFAKAEEDSGPKRVRFPRRRNNAVGSERVSRCFLIRFPKAMKAPSFVYPSKLSGLWLEMP
jgi:hypothetical protein